MSAKELLPCPFCGGEAVQITIDESEPNNVGGDVIVCLHEMSSIFICRIWIQRESGIYME